MESGTLIGCFILRYNSRHVLSYHLYCVLMDSNGQVSVITCTIASFKLPACFVVVEQPLDTYLCDGSDEEVMKIQIADTERMGVAGFLTEW